MSSPEPQKQSLIPAGLPLSYIGGYAVVGIASLAYISLMMSGSGPSRIDNATAKFAQGDKPSIEHNLAAAGERPTSSDDAATKPPHDATQTREQIADAEPSAGIETRYVTTQQILASRLREESAVPATETAQTTETTLPAETGELTSGTSSITTGSITVPPPPERAPPRPAILRTALKPAVAPTLPNAPKKKAAKAPAAPIEFGPAVVTETKAQPEAPSALAILLASGSSVESLRLTWNLLQERHSAALGNLEPRYIIEKNPANPERGFALLAGPVISATEVARVCSALVSEGLSCRTTTFGGNAL